MKELISSTELPVPEYKLFEIGVVVTSTEILDVPYNNRKGFIEYKLGVAGVPVVLTDSIDTEDIKVAYGTLHSFCDTNKDCMTYTWRLKWIE